MREITREEMSRIAGGSDTVVINNAGETLTFADNGDIILTASKTGFDTDQPRNIWEVAGDFFGFDGQFGIQGTGGAYVTAGFSVWGASTSVTAVFGGDQSPEVSGLYATVGVGTPGPSVGAGLTNAQTAEDLEGLGVQGGAYGLQGSVGTTDVVQLGVGNTGASAGATVNVGLAAERLYENVANTITYYSDPMTYYNQQQ